MAHRHARLRAVIVGVPWERPAAFTSKARLRTALCQKSNRSTMLEVGLKTHVLYGMLFSSDPARTVTSILGSLGVLQRLEQPDSNSSSTGPVASWLPSIQGSSGSKSECRIATIVVKMITRNQHVGLWKGFSAVHILGQERLLRPGLDAQSFRHLVSLLRSTVATTSPSFWMAPGPWAGSTSKAQQRCRHSAGETLFSSTAACTLILLPPRVIPKSWRKPDSYLGPSWPGKAILVQLP